MNKYLPVKINRLFHGYASVRDYQVEEARAQNKGLKIILGDEQIYVPFNKLDDGYVNDELITSKHGTKPYRLVDYDWKTYRPVLNDVQYDLFNSLLMLELKTP